MESLGAFCRLASGATLLAGRCSPVGARCRLSAACAFGPLLRPAAAFAAGFPLRDAATPARPRWRAAIVVRAAPASCLHIGAHRRRSLVLCLPRTLRCPDGGCPRVAVACPLSRSSTALWARSTRARVARAHARGARSPVPFGALRAAPQRAYARAPAASPRAAHPLTSACLFPRLSWPRVVFPARSFSHPLCLSLPLHTRPSSPPPPPPPRPV